MDTSILLSTNALLSSAAALVLFVVLRTRKTYPGFGFWTVGVACLAVGAAMLVPGALPQAWWVRVLRNAMLLAGLLLVLRGMLLFRGLHVSYRWDGLLAALFLVVFGYFSLDAAQVSIRIAIYCGIAGALCLATAGITLRHRPPYFGSNDIMLALWMVLYGMLSFVRLAQELGDPNTSTAFEALKGFGSFYAMSQVLTVQLITLTLISMNSQRIEFEYAMSESRLRESEEQVRSIGDKLPDGFVYRYHIRNEQSFFSYISAGVEKMLGVTPAEVLADPQCLFARMAPDSLTQYLADEARCLRERIEYAGVLLFLLPDGRRLWLHARSAPTVSPNGDVAWVGVAVDITKLKEAEAELDKHRNHLEELIQERTLALAEKTLAAQAASVSKTTFLANMSHEIRTPLNAITGMAALIRRDGLTPFQTDKLAKLEAASDHLLHILNDILDLSKIDANKLEVEQAPLALESVVSNVLTMVAVSAQSKHLALHSEVQALPGNLRGDATRLQQALLNYVSNAIKFTTAGRVTVRVRCESEGPDDALIRFEVADTGIGIEPQVLNTLFSEFVQADNSTTRKYGGTGLGLAITGRLAHLMGGATGASSVPGVGSTFWFTARLAKGPSSVGQPAPGPVEDPAVTLRQQHQGTRVLVAEDEPVNSEITSILLEDVGLAVDLAEDGQRAVEMASKTQYGLILMDMQMPRLNGLDATRQIRQLPGYARTPIVAMTANAFSEDKAQCLAAGMSSFISKPVPPAVLYQALVQELEAASPRDA
jgi:PAS domain S-box-containing protein